MGPGCPTLGGPLRRHVMEGSSLGGQRLRLHLPDVITRARGALPALREELLAFPVNKGHSCCSVTPQMGPPGGQQVPVQRRQGLGCQPRVSPNSFRPKAGCRVCQGDF